MTKYEGTINWREGKPEKSGKCIATLTNNWVDVVYYDKAKGFITDTESENGGNITFPDVIAWAYLPEPYKKG